MQRIKNAMVGKGLMYALIESIVRRVIEVREMGYLDGNPWNFDLNFAVHIDHIEKDTYMERTLWWGAGEGLFHLTAPDMKTTFTRYSIRVTEKFYFDYILPEMVKNKTANWASILIKDTAMKHKGVKNEYGEICL